MYRVGLSLHLAQGESAPRGYGLAYADHARGEYVLLPIGINHLYAFWRKCSFWVRFSVSKSAYDDVWVEASNATATRFYESEARAAERAFELGVLRGAQWMACCISHGEDLPKPVNPYREAECES